MLNHSGPYHFVQKVGFFKYLQDLSLCPYKSTTRVILHLMTYGDINCEETMLLNYFHFLSQKMLNHSGPYHFVQKVGFFKYLQDLSLCGSYSISLTFRDIYITSFQFVPINPLPFCPKSGVFQIFTRMPKKKHKGHTPSHDIWGH